MIKGKIIKGIGGFYYVETPILYMNVKHEGISEIKKSHLLWVMTLKSPSMIMLKTE